MSSEMGINEMIVSRMGTNRDAWVSFFVVEYGKIRIYEFFLVKDNLLKCLLMFWILLIDTG